MRLKICSQILLVILLGVIPYRGTWAQTTRGTIVGTIQDQQGGAIPGATVTVANPATALSRVVQTASNGSFRVPELPNGSYRLTAEAKGFSKGVIETLEVAVDQTRTVDLVLKVASQSEAVTVEGTVGLASTESSQLGAVIDQTKVTELPLNGRNFAQLAVLNPGVASFGGGGGQQGGEGGVSGFASNGQRSSSNNFLVDGIDNNDYIGGAVAQLPPIDSVQEFEVQTNTFAAEFGRNSGAVVNLVTKSGTNQFHGAAYEFLRNDKLDARNFFANPSFAKPELRLNQFGFVLGGPIVKDKTFFFGSYEGFRQRAGITKLTNVPSLAERMGTFGSVTVPVNAVSAMLFNLFPPPTPGASNPHSFVASPKLRNDTDEFLVKADHQLDASDNLALRYSCTRADLFFPFVPGQGGTTIPGYGVITSNTNHLASISYTRILSPASLNEFRFGFTRVTDLNVNEKGPQADTFGFATGHAANSPLNLGNIPNITFSGGLVSGGGAFSNLGGTINNPSGDWQNTLQFIDNFSHTTARHTMKFGLDIRNIRANRLYDLAFSGQIIFDGSQNAAGPGMTNIPNPMIDFAEGLPAASLQFVGDSARSFRTTSYNLFAQDSFKIRSNLTLNYGLRYQLDTVITDATHRVATWRANRFLQFLSPTASQTDLATLEKSGLALPSEVGGLWAPNHKNFAPRLGLAWSLGSRRHTVLRAAYGIFYDTILGNIPTNVMLNPPFLPAYFVPAPFVTWPNAFPQVGGFPVLTFPAAKLPVPYSQAYNLNIQRELPWDLLFEVGYVGTKGTHLARFRQIDQAYITPAQISTLVPDVVTRMTLLGIPLPVAQFLSMNIGLMPSIVRGPYFGYAQLFEAENVVNSEYNSLQTKLEKRMSHGLTFLLAYTYSKSIDGASVFFGSGANGTTIFPQDNYNLRAERGRSDFDTRHRFVASYVYQVPSLRRVISSLPTPIANGWEFAGILTLQSGQPFSILTGSNQSSTGLGNDRPDVTCNPNTGPHTVQQWFNTTCFTLNAPLTFGISGRNILQGPDFKNYDFSLIKNTKIWEQVNLQFRAEFFNILNHPNFALPNNVLNAPNFGQLFQTPDVAQNNVGLGSGGPRLIQFGFKLNF
jgi:hypothetical protein